MLYGVAVVAIFWKPPTLGGSVDRGSIGTRVELGPAGGMASRDSPSSISSIEEGLSDHGDPASIDALDERENRPIDERASRPLDQRNSDPGPSLKQGSGAGLEPEPEPLPEPRPTSESEIEPESVPQSVREPESALEPEPDFESEPETQPETKAISASESEPKPDPAPLPVQESDPDMEPEFELDPKTESEPEPEFDLHLESSADEAAGEPGVDANSEPEFGSKDSTGFESKAGTGGEADGEKMESRGDSMGGAPFESGDTGQSPEVEAGVHRIYMQTLQVWLERHQRYPRRARRKQQEGTAIVRIVVDRDGEITSYELIQSTGYRLLDKEVREMIERASPLPAIPTEMTHSRLEIKIPIAFSLR